MPHYLLYVGCLVFVNLLKKTLIISLPLFCSAQSTLQHMLSCYECIKGYRSQKTCQVVSRKMRAKEVCTYVSISILTLLISPQAWSTLLPCCVLVLAARAAGLPPVSAVPLQEDLEYGDYDYTDQVKLSTELHNIHF